MSISSPAGSSGVLPQQQFASHSHATRNNPSPQPGNELNVLSTVQPPGSPPPVSATTATAASATATGIGMPSASQSDAGSQQLTSLGSYLLSLQPNTIPGTTGTAATPGTPPTVTNAASAAAASQYMAASASTSSIVSSTMIC
jgi:hypothetical protein